MTIPGFVAWPPEPAERYRRLGLWEGVTVSGMVARGARAWPDRIALKAGALTLSYAGLVERMDRLALRMLELGIGRGERVLMQLPNGPEFALAYLALNRIGAIPVMAMRAHRHAEVRHFLDASAAVAYLIADRIGDFDYRTMAESMRAQCPALRQVWVAGEPLDGQIALFDRAVLGDVSGEPPAPPSAAALAPPDAAALAGLDAAALAGLDTAALARLDAASPSPGDLSTMLLSGGTTSMSKLIPRTHDDYVLNARLCGEVAGFDADTVLLVILPLGHNYNLASPGMLGAFYHGATVVLAPGTDVESIFATIARERVSVVAAVVPLIANWLASDVPDRYDISSLRVIQNGGARLPTEMRRRLRERFGCVPQEVYGTAEGLINMTRLDEDDAWILESSGSPVSDEDELRVLDDQDRDLPDGEPGELVTRGPYTIRGYFDAPVKNAEAFLPGGWYRMGDIVRKRGRHVFTEGRRKDMINRGGEKISCDEVEGLIVRHPAVQSVSLVAMPDPVFGERACACVIAKQGASLTLAELVGFLRAQGIASFKLPERLELMQSFPLSPVGKILKRALREQVAARPSVDARP